VRVAIGTDRGLPPPRTVGADMCDGSSRELGMKLHTEATTFALDDAVEAYRKLAAGEINGRAVIVP